MTLEKFENVASTIPFKISLLSYMGKLRLDFYKVIAFTDFAKAITSFQKHKCYAKLIPPYKIETKVIACKKQRQNF